MLTSCLIDSREPLTFQKLDYGVPSIVTTLDADLVAGCSDGNTLAIERKTVDDMLGSIRDGSLLNQCYKMRKAFEFCYIVVTGFMQRAPSGNVQVIRHMVWYETGWNWDAVQGALLTFQEMGVGVVFAEDFREAVFRLAKRDRGSVTIHPVRKSEPMSEDEAVLAAFPGIGAITAKKILAQNSLAWALCWMADLESKMKYRGFSHNQKVHARNRVLKLKPNEKFWIRVMEETKGKGR